MQPEAYTCKGIVTPGLITEVGTLGLNGISFRVTDATLLDLEKESFDGAALGFNGLMQIPLRASRREALNRIAAVIRPGGYFVFTTHDRDLNSYRDLWTEERRFWGVGEQTASPLEFATVLFRRPKARPSSTSQIRTGFDSVETQLRSDPASESAQVREFSEECRFWIAKRIPAD